MATTTSKKAVQNTKKIIVTGDEVNPTMLGEFCEVVGSSLDREVQVWLTGCDLMARSIITVRGMQSTLEKVINEKGNLPTLTTSSVQYWGKALELRSLKGGEKKTLKQLFQLARETSSFVNASNKGKKKTEQKSFADIITGKSIESVRQTVPTQGEVKKRKPSTDKNTKYSDKAVHINDLVKALDKRLKSGKGKENKVDMALIEALAETINAIMFESEEAVA
jgi:uncharacterized protein Veg